ncbi:MAG: transcriptional regulator, TetR family [Alphaproteobacteria bacterium]|nr:transcriptional regulator, TetR family [Alphaproteobacteria bacterium]
MPKTSAVLATESVRQPAKSTATRRKILDAAARTFRDKGYAATTLNDIADAAEIRAASLYYYFRSKEDLLEAVFGIGMQRVVDAVRQRSAALPANATLAQRIEVAIEAHLEMLLQQGDYTSANIRIFGQVPKSVQRKQLPLRQDYAEFWRELLETAQRSGEIRPEIDLGIMRMLIFGALNWCTEWADPKKGPVREIARQACLLVLNGIAAEGKLRKK